ncbi:hypothetical protein [Olene mendosa nucleopolyhedrovirus]|uniref:Late expression factor 11 n=1 Tax=Olene mendosa nucleopolyhedrovirus TaxID=2933796 RepID=A0AAX3AXE2_9ABAC|nr:hypothetical protein QKV28_gp132 [Olene mendosa nucleopolyhedrovirus]UOQ18915.1 hypothetical protein [Olene mendosa nucleopolyhedrovirus]
MARIYKRARALLQTVTPRLANIDEGAPFSRNGSPLQHPIYQDDPRRRDLGQLLSELRQTRLLFERHDVRAAFEAPAGAQKVKNDCGSAAELAVLRVQQRIDRLYGLGRLRGMCRILQRYPIAHTAKRRPRYLRRK